MKTSKAFSRRPTSRVSALHDRHSDRAGTYRLFTNDKVSCVKILSSHREVLQERAEEAAGRVLVIQDTSSLNYTTHKKLKGVGRIGTHEKGTQGFLMHSAIVLEAGNDRCLGVLSQEIYTHKEHTSGQNRKEVPIEEKESMRWIRALECAHTYLPEAIVIGDRENDIFEYYQKAQELNSDIIVRLSWNRKIAEESSNLWAHLEAMPEACAYPLVLEKETVQLSLRYGEVTLLPPQREKTARGNREYTPLKAMAVYVTGKKKDGSLITWRLLSNMRITTPESAQEIVRYYAKRWHIESFHKCLKTGYGIEKARLESATSMEKLFLTLSIVAAFLYSTLHAARAFPDHSSALFLTDKQELKALCRLMKIKKPPSIKQFVLFTATKGGFIPTKKYPFPGILTFWQGWTTTSAQILAIKTCV